MDRVINGDDDDDLRLLSERVLPSASVSSTNNTSPRNSNRIRSLKPQKRISSENHIYNESDGPLPTIANTGDIIQLNDGTRKKYNGSSWRRMCSKPNCSYYTQSSGLCKPHLAAMQKRQSPSTSKDTPKVNVEAVPFEQPSSKTKEPKKGDIIVLSNGIRKKHDGRQYRRICANSTCAAVVHGSLEYQNGLCPHHYQEYRSKDLSQSTSSPEPAAPSPSPPPPPVIASPSPSRKRRRAPSPSPSEPKSSLPKSNHRLPIGTIPSTVDMKNPKKGDIIEMENGSRKKFDGVVWRKICSIPDCFIAAQRDELCRKHFIKLNGKPNTLYTTDILGSVSMVPPVSKSLSSMSASSIGEKFGSQSSKKLREESRDYDDDEQEEVHLDQLSNLSDHESHEHNGHDRDHSFTIEDDNFGVHLDHSLIDALSASRQKFPTNFLKKWLREHRVHPYPSNQEKLELAKQSSITYDQVTTWFNNARAILRRQQAKLRRSLDKSCADEVEDHDDDNEDGDGDNHQLVHENRKRSDSNQKIATRASRPLPLFNGVCCRSIGVQCNPSTANQTTSTSSEVPAMTDEDIRADRTMRILTPSADVLRSLSLKRTASQEFLVDDIKIEDDDDGTNNEQMVVTSTCLDDEQLTRLKDFCSRFHIELSNAVDHRTTHLITDEEEGETLVCPLSKKVIQAVARHMYIITYRWIDACLRANEIINEKPFEIQGDLTLSSDHHGMQRSRQSVPSPNLPKSTLLENYSIMIKCDGCQEMMNTEELIELTGITRIVLCEKEYLMHRQEMYDKCIHAGVQFLTPEWFLESLVQYRIQPFQEYQITP